MCRIDCSVRLIAPCHYRLASRYVHVAKHTAEHSQRSKRLIKGNFVACFIDSHEAVITVLSHFAILSSVNNEGCIACSAEFCGVRVIKLEGYGLPAKPVADVVSVTMIHCYANGVVENHFEVCEEVWVREVARFLKGVINIVVGFCVIQIDTKGGLARCEVQVVDKVSWGCGVFVRVADAAGL